MLSLFNQVPPSECDEFEKRLSMGRAWKDRMEGRVELEARGIFPIQ